jgi:inorganic pyrophosphatase
MASSHRTRPATVAGGRGIAAKQAMEGGACTTATEYLGKAVMVTVDRPLGSRHPEHGFGYDLNYGYVPRTLMPDGEALDAYVLGVQEPLEKFSGICIAVIRRIGDPDDKLVLAPAGEEFTDAQIRALTAFQERFFTSIIIREQPNAQAKAGQP